MTTVEFDKIVEETLQEIRQTLISKGDEYANEDRLSNFKSAAKLNEEFPEQSLWGFVTKHIIALKDFILSGMIIGKLPSGRQWKEKTGDIICYMILLRALLKERNIE